MTPRASVAICAYTLDRWGELQAAVASVRRQAPAPDEVLVVIDGNDELLERVVRAFPDVRAMANAQAPGANGARNTAAAAATGDVLVLLDDDAAAEPGWLAAHLAAYADERVIGTGGTIVPDWRGGAPDRLPPELWWLVGSSWAGTPTTAAPIRNAVAANMSVRVDVVASAGGFRNDLGRLDRPGAPVTGTAEETEFCIRAVVAHPGRHFVHVPGAVVRHAVPASRTTWRYLVDRSRLEGEAKAALVDHVGSAHALRDERRFLWAVVPRGIARELAAAVHGDRHGPERAAAIVLSVLVTGGAWLRMRAVRRLRARRDRSEAPKAS